MADGDLALGGYADAIQPPVDLGLSVSPDLAPGSFSNTFAMPTVAGGSPGTVSSPAPVAAPVAPAATTPLAAAAATPAATTTSTGGVGNWLSTTAGNIGNWVTQNPMTALGAVAGGGMLLSEMFGSGHDAESQTMKQLGQQAASAQSTATMLQAPLTSGVLPPGAQAAVNAAQQSGRTAAISSYAKMGMSGSTGEADAIQASNQAAQAMKFGIAQQLFTQASGYAKLASDDYAGLLKAQMEQDQDFSNALSKFVSALAGGKSSTTTTSQA